MRYLIDTNVCIDYLQGMPYVEPLLRSLSNDGKQRLLISLATYGELLAGIPYARDPHASQQGLDALLAGMRILPLSRPIVERFARLKAELAHSKQLIGDVDTLIAATALHHGLTLVTRNRRHFERVPGLKTSYP